QGNTLFKTEVTALYHKDNSLLNWRDTITFYSPDSMDLYMQFRDEYTDRAELSLTPTLVQKIKQFWYLSAGVELGIKTEQLDRQQEIDREGGISLDTLLPPFSTRNLSAGPALSLKRNSSKSQIEFILKGRWNQFDKVLDGTSVEKPTYFYFQPGFNYEYKYRKGRRINVRYKTHVNMPSVNQLYPVTNTLNLLSIYQGNLELTPEYSHDISFSWWYFDQFSFTSLFAMVGAEYIRDKIGWSQSTNDQLITLVTPVNTPDHRSAYSYISFSTPIRPLGIKVSLVSYESWNKGLSIINGDNNSQSNFTHSLRLRFENRKKEKWDIAVGGNVSITDANFSISSMNTVYFNTTIFSDIRFTPNERWSFETEANVVNYNSRSFNEAVSIPLLNAGISYYFLRGERASLTLRGYDLLNKQVGFERISQTNYLMQREWNTIGRYLMLEFHLRIGR
ncbi:MAG: outer membrane beta-barrel protein, partial [Bacteroidales bacterium]|nr:outer membrane beta-barrel protein [Bacteroidales bacterium]